MRLALAPAVVAALALALAAPAPAGAAATQVRELRLGDGEARAGVGTFELVGVHWRGSGAVELRVRAAGGGWSGWHRAAPSPEDRPDTGWSEGASDGSWRLGAPWWTGPSDRWEVRTRGDVREVRVYTVESPASLVPLRRKAATAEPAVVSRQEWGANESIRRGEPAYAPEVRFAVVHHTAGSSTYTRAEAPAVVRAIQRYHVQANGWNDIGYNFLVDRFGTVYEGRYGGTTANVVGAHAQGFNTGSVGVALLGTFDAVQTSPAAERSLTALLAWRLDLAHVDPQALVTVASGGSPKYAAGLPVTLRVVSGHRDVGLTACPGAQLHDRIGPVATGAARLGLPKLYEPAVATEGVSVAFSARLSAALPWEVEVADATGAVVARGSGRSSTIGWTWDVAGTPAGTYRWTMRAGTSTSTTTEATGELETGVEVPPVEVTEAVASPASLSPNGDGVADTGTVRFRLNAPATVAALVRDPSGTLAAELEPARWRRAGTHALPVTVDLLPDGPYTVELLAAASDGSTSSATVGLTVTRTLRDPVLNPVVVSPNGDGRADVLRLAFTLTRPAEVTVTALRDGAPVATISSGHARAGRQVVRWDGTKPGGRILDGAFTVTVAADDGITIAGAELAFESDTTPPRLRLVSRVPPVLAVSEAVSVAVTVNGERRRLRTAAPGLLRLQGVRRVATLEATAWDRGGNTTSLRVRESGAPAK